MAARVLVAGASGLIGTGVLESFLDADWPAVAVSRRAPEPVTARPFRHLGVDLRDQAACAAACRDLGGITHVVFTALHEVPGLFAGWSDEANMQLNLEMLVNLLEPLTAVADIQHVSLLQGGKAYGTHLHPVPIPARERFPRDPHANFYWLQEDYLRQKAVQRGFGWTIFRPVVVIGPGYGGAMNVAAVIGVYGALCRELRRPFGFPGGEIAIRQAVDARLIGQAAVWAATSPSAHGEYYNLTNGEVFTWPDIWPCVADAMGHDIADATPTRLTEFLPAHRDLWDQIVRAHGLRPLALDQVLGESHFFADWTFNYGVTELRRPTILSSVKIRQAGFGQCYDTEESLQHSVEVLRSQDVIPR